MTQATKRPWILTSSVIIADKECNEIIANCSPILGNFKINEAEANAKLIVKAVNERDELIEALKLAIATIKDMGVDISGIIPTGQKLDILRKALSKAESED